MAMLGLDLGSAEAVGGRLDVFRSYAESDAASTMSASRFKDAWSAPAYLAAGTDYAPPASSPTAGPPTSGGAPSLASASSSSSSLVPTANSSPTRPQDTGLPSPKSPSHPQLAPIASPQRPSPPHRSASDLASPRSVDGSQLSPTAPAGPASGPPDHHLPAPVLSVVYNSGWDEFEVSRLNAAGDRVKSRSTGQLSTTNIYLRGLSVT